MDYIPFKQYLYHAWLHPKGLTDFADRENARKARRITLGFFFLTVPFLGIYWLLDSLFSISAMSYGMPITIVGIAACFLLPFICSIPAHRKIYKRLRANAEAMRAMFSNRADEK